MKLKLMTLNLHCFAEEDIQNKQKIIAEFINDLDIDIICFQEVSQKRFENNLYQKEINKDNYGLIIKNILLKKYNKKYFYYYESIKRSFDVLDEGVAVLSKYNLKLILSKVISKTTDYNNWKKRKILAYKIENIDEDIIISTTHFGWSDEEESFENQFMLATKSLYNLSLVILAGDFNIKYLSKEYKFVKNKGWFDLFEDNLEYIQEPTFEGEEKSRLDYFFTNKKVKILDQDIVFKNKRVSDHFGVYVVINTK